MKKYVSKDYKVNMMVCWCKHKKQDDLSIAVVAWDILIDGSSVNNYVAVNRSLVGAVGFDVEILTFLDTCDKPMKVLFAYDSYYSHSTIYLGLAKSLGLCTGMKKAVHCSRNCERE